MKREMTIILENVAIALFILPNCQNNVVVAVETTHNIVERFEFLLLFSHFIELLNNKKKNATETRSARLCNTSAHINSISRDEHWVVAG